MIYKALSFSLTPAEAKYIEILYALLDEKGFDGIFEEGNEIIAYIKSSQFVPDDISYLETKLSDLGCRLVWSVRDLEDQNWNKIWESNFNPVLINEDCVILAPFHDQFPDVKYRIIIEPKMSFGTGHHQTTRMMVEHILEYDFQGKNILDMGCGTGILSILASLRGAKQVTAIDIDKWAYENSNENAVRNNVDNIKILLGGRDVIPNEKFDIILANINRNILLDQFENYAGISDPGSLLLISGILNDDVQIMLNTALKHGYNYVKKKSLENWSLIVFRKN